MSYDQLGYTNLLSRTSDDLIVLPDNTQSIDPLTFDQSIDEISGSKIRGESVSSKNSNVVIDLENENFIVKNNGQERVRFGKVNNQFTMSLIDDNGNTILDQSGIDLGHIAQTYRKTDASPFGVPTTVFKGIDGLLTFLRLNVPSVVTVNLRASYFGVSATLYTLLSVGDYNQGVDGRTITNESEFTYITALSFQEAKFELTRRLEAGTYSFFVNAFCASGSAIFSDAIMQITVLGQSERIF